MIGRRRFRGLCYPGRAPRIVDQLSILDPGEDTNIAVLAGVILHSPTREKRRDDEPITVFQVVFPAPDDRTRRAAACCDIEVPDELADEQRDHLQAGRRVMVFGRLSGPGGLWATSIVLA